MLHWILVGWTSLFAAVASADERAPLVPGAPAPAWTGLPGTDDKAHSLSDLDAAPVVVVAFTCNDCPFAESYEDRLIDFAEAYASRGVALVAINVSTEPANRMPAMKTRAAAKGFPFPYLFDASQRIGKAYGAKVTPHIFVLNKKRKVAYVGAFDDSRVLDRVKHQYVQEAVEALLDGKEPAVEKTRAVGCLIHYE